MPTFAVIGAGGWGTALACYLAHKEGVQVRLWVARPESYATLKQNRENTRQLPGVRIPDAVQITASVTDATDAADAWIVAVPTGFLRPTLARFRGLASSTTPVISLTKGLEIGTFRRPSEILAEVLGVTRLIALSGPSHAEEVARGLPTSLVAACPDDELANWVRDAVGGERLRVYSNRDLVGVELAGALKNVMGIAAGVCDGLKYGDNAKAALLTRGLVEMRRFGVVNGADAETFVGLAGLGDLITTCFSPHGRNRRAGELLATGATLVDVTAGPMVAEGVFTARSVHERATRDGVEVPILSGVYRMLYCGLSPREAVQELLHRPQKEEAFG